MRLQVCLLFTLTLPACGPDRIEVAPLAEGEWAILDATSPRAILAQRRGGPTQLRVLGDSLEAARQETLSARVRASSLGLTRIVDGQRETYLANHGMARLQRSPADPGLYALEYEDAVWVWKASDRTMNQLTVDAGLDSLRAKQREGAVILYWTADPLWSGDGEFIGFMTNRHGVRGNTASQGIRVVHTGTGIEKDVYAAVGVSVHIDGVLGEEFAFSSSGAPGVWAVHPRTAATRKLGDGFLVGFDARGRGIVINHDRRLVLLRGAVADTLPEPPRGFSYTSHAFFSPSGNRIAMFSTNERGVYLLHVYDAAARRGLQADVPGGPSYGPVWASDEVVIFAAARPSSPLTTYRATLR